MILFECFFHNKCLFFKCSMWWPLFLTTIIYRSFHDSNAFCSVKGSTLNNLSRTAFHSPAIVLGLCLESHLYSRRNPQKSMGITSGRLGRNVTKADRLHFSIFSKNSTADFAICLLPLSWWSSTVWRHYVHRAATLSLIIGNKMRLW